MPPWPRYALALTVSAVVAAAIGYHLAFSPHRPSAPPPAVMEASAPNVAVVRREADKARLACEVKAGRLSLLEAAAGFKALDADGPPAPGWVYPQRPPGMSEEESYCRNVIAWVRGTAPPNQADDTTCALEAELYVRLQEGTLQLPDAPSVVTLPMGE